MNHTASGAIAVGAPKSAARFASEAQHALDNQYQLLLLTAEGRELLKRFFKSVGYDFNAMDDEQASNAINEKQQCLLSFLAGVTFEFSKL